MLTVQLKAGSEEFGGVRRSPEEAEKASSGRRRQSSRESVNGKNGGAQDRAAQPLSSIL